MIVRYTLFYAGLMIAASVLMFTINTVFDLPGSNGASIAMVILIAVFTGQIFAREQSRAPTRKERHQLAGAFTAAGVAISIVQISLILWLALSAMERQLLLDDLDSELVDIMLGVSIIVTLILYGVTWLGIGLGAKSMLKKQAKQRAQ
ncbi:ABZJ_00895 family protein [Marinobacter sp. OP 3.4]|uniref:ABZJ_00895 family protein n=1 Tax=Marinobacter sp. OP 3.4 TaxID=3076501 RepID=UPI002E1E6FD8